MHFDERIHRFIWEAAGNPYLVETLERYFTHSLRIWYLVLDRVPGLGHAVHDQAHLLEGRPARARPRPLSHDHARARAGLPARDHGGVQPRLAARDGCRTCMARSPQRTRARRPTVPPPVAVEVGGQGERPERWSASPSASWGRCEGSRGRRQPPRARSSRGRPRRAPCTALATAAPYPPLAGA